MVSYCMTVCDRSHAVQRFLSFLQDLEDPNFELVLVDHGSTDIDYQTSPVITQSDLSVRVIQRGRVPFNRSVGLNMAAAAAKGDLYFFVDCDMRITPRFNELVRKHVQPNTCWFPICYSLHKDRPCRVRGDYQRGMRMMNVNGWWRSTGYGMCGFTREDFARVTWDEITGKSYGREDVYLAQTCRATGFNVVRERCEDLFHIWHPIQREHYEEDARAEARERLRARARERMAERNRARASL